MRTSIGSAAASTYHACSTCAFVYAYLQAGDVSISGSLTPKEAAESTLAKSTLEKRGASIMSLVPPVTPPVTPRPLETPPHESKEHRQEKIKKLEGLMAFCNNCNTRDQTCGATRRR